MFRFASGGWQMTQLFDFSIKTDLRPDPVAPDARRHYAEVLDEIRLADTLGYRGVWTTEYHGQDDGYLAAQLPALAAFAVATAGLRLGTGVIPLPYYRIRQVLESAVVVDALSGGRLDLGVGAGGDPREFDLFGVEMGRRGQLVEDGIRRLRQGLLDGVLPDGPDDQLVPLGPRTVQDRVPILVGGSAAPAIDRAVRLGDGFIGASGAGCERTVPEHFRTAILPALQRHSRSLHDFRYIVGAPLWVTDDGEKDWQEVFGPAFRYQQEKYGVSLDFDIDDVLIGSVGDLAARLLGMRAQAPWHEFAFYHRLPGVPHQRALEQIELVSSKLAPAINAAS